MASHFSITDDSSLVSNSGRSVRWDKPKAPAIKLNTDGSVSANNAGLGGMIRDHNGKPLGIFSGPLLLCSVLTAELMALHQGLEICMKYGYQVINIEVDSKILLQVISGISVGCLQDYYTIRKINNCLANLNYTISHVFREGNACADWLAKFGSHSGVFQEHNLNNLPVPLSGMICMDKLGLPYIRHT
ncbi:uncharacterized protein LOC110095571 [Dendrobium catenatum]|uniref:uncharacterized protein LOC110095571 n=1 Tax=Dendrobium catenatum TaxID=906689 RepID=UPI0009F7162D|nr:uncharacterized protein LOC110095571 [Dendrobium catenatum]